MFLHYTDGAHLLTERRVNKLKKLVKWFSIFAVIGTAIGLAVAYFCKNSSDIPEENDPAGDQLHLFLGRRQEQPYFHTGKRIAYKNKAGGILHIKPYHNAGRRHSNGNRRSNGNGGSQQQRAKDSSHRIVSLVRFFVISTRILIFPVSGARTVPFPHSPQHFSSPEGFPCRFS